MGQAHSASVADRYPDAAEFAAHVASLWGCRRIVDAAGLWTPELRLAYPALTPLPAGASDAPTSILATAETLPAVGALDGCPLLVLVGEDCEAIDRLLAEHSLAPTFAGRTRAHDADDTRSAHLYVVDRALDRALAQAGPPPDDFRVVAIMLAFNEEDVIGPAIEKLVSDGVGVYVIDNWSTDRTHEIARSFLGRGLVGIERFPEAPDDRFVLRALLARSEAVAATLEADWFIHHDADERRLGPWPGIGLRESLWRIDRAGFNAVDFTVANYRPIDDGFVPGSDFEAYFRRFEFGATSDLLLQIKAWKNTGRVDLAGAAGHQARFPGRRVFPYKFLLKHYPIRSQQHGERKVHRERIARWDRHERVRGWHSHYDEMAAAPSFLRDPAELIADEGAGTWTQYLPEALTGAGLIRRNYPAWALRGPAGRRLYLVRESARRSRAAGLTRNGIGKVRGLARRVRARLARRA